MNRRITATIVTIALLAWSQNAAGAGRGVAPPCCGDLVLSQNNDTSVITDIPAFGGAGHTTENAYARCFSSAELPADFHLQCVEFGIFQNTSPIGADFNVELRIVRLVQTAAFPTLSCPLPLPAPAFGSSQSGNPWFDIPPEYELLHLQTVPIPDQFSGLMRVILTTPLHIPAGADILVEVHAVSRAPGVGGDDGAFRLGGNEANASGATLWWEPFALTAYQDLVSIDAAFTADWVVLLKGTSGTILPPPIDCNGNGVADECDPDLNGNGVPDACEIPNQGLCCGDTGITQNSDVSVVSNGSPGCFDNGGSVSVETAFARCFNGTDFPTDFTLQCVEFGVTSNFSPTGQDYDVGLRITQLAPTQAFPSLTCPLPTGIPGLVFGDPQLGQTWFDAPPEFNVLRLQSVTIPEGATGVLLQFFLEPPLVIPAGADILFELHAPSRAIADGGDGGVFRAGINHAATVGESYIWAPFCGLVDYRSLISIDATFTHQWVVRLNGVFSPVAPPAVDCNANGVPDECETDCNANGIPDECDVDALDPDGNGLTSLDCNANGIPDECETDCNANGIPDDCDIDPLDPDGDGLVSPDCNANGIPDECETDCNANGVPDDCDIDLTDPDGNGQFSTDCNFNGIPDECDVDPADPDGDGLVSADCQPDLIPDVCQANNFFYSLSPSSLIDLASGLPNGGTMAWMNHYTVRAGSETVGSIWMKWGTVANGTPAVVYLWSDPNGDGDPTDAQVLASAVTVVQNANTPTNTVVAIPGTFVGPAGTSFFAGAIITHQAGEKPVPLDTDVPAGPTWLVGDAAGPIDPNNLASAAIPPFVAVNGAALVLAEAPGDDCNNSGVPDICEGSDDVALFVGEVIAAVPNPLLTCLFDGNGDGAVNGLDIQSFVDGLLSGP